MPVIMGSGHHTYRLDEGWGKLPEGWSFNDVAAVGVDRQDRVYIFNRGAHPMIVFDRDGNFLRSWGEGIFRRPHGVHVGPDDTIYCTDEGDHTVRKCTLDGRVLLEIGIPGKPAPCMSGDPFHRCTHTALSPGGDIYVSDGYGNSRVHKYAPDGRFLMSWGEPGTDPGQFNLPHNICCDDEGWIYVADRENHRVQVFDGAGVYETQWNNLHRPCALFMAPGPKPICYIGELAPALAVNLRTPNLGARVSIVTNEGKPLARIGAPLPGLAPGQFMSPHGIAVDSHGDIYVGEVAFTTWPRFHPNEPPPVDLRSLQKWVRVDAAV
ncbi:MAG: hypothetical protein EXQ92_10965 [Alphaproteobacteria bacterium]|nr:hypothetical protein [Alphaproteobacteria bacterium]